jgi:hypothetical protein
MNCVTAQNCPVAPIGANYDDFFQGWNLDEIALPVEREGRGA